MKELKTVKTKLGELELLGINDFTEVQIASEFFPTVTEEEWQVFKKLYPNRITEDLIVNPFPYFCYLIKDGSETILVDTGVGGGPETGKNYSPDWQGTLLEKMLEENILPEDVTMVIFTHFHADHVGWATKLVDGEYVKTFPKARYIAQRAAYDAYHDGLTSGAFPTGCFDVCVQVLYDRGELELVDVEYLKVSEHVTIEKREGHTPGSMCVVAESDGRKAVLAGDCLASPIQITDPKQDYIWDIDRVKAIQSKNDILELYGAEGNLIGGCHFGIGQIELKNGKRYWKELE